jgi:hypothetical protein
VPSSCDTVSRVVPVSRFVIFTFAPATAAPFASLTVPTTNPLLVCASAELEARVNSTSVAALRNSLNFDMQLLLESNTDKFEFLAQQLQSKKMESVRRPKEREICFSLPVYKDGKEHAAIH